MFRFSNICLLLFATSAAAQQLPDATKLAHDFDMRWYYTPGEWVVPGFLDAGSFFLRDCDKPNKANFKCSSVIMRVEWREPQCFKFEDPFITKDGRVIPGKVTETGMFGEPGWTWEFETTELFTGAFEWHVKTVDVCPRVG